MPPSQRRVVKHHIKRATARDTRHRIEAAQRAVLAGGGNRRAAEYAEGRRVLAEFGVEATENVTQSPGRVRGWWRVYAEPVS